MTPDTNVVIAASSPWHERHDDAAAACAPVDRLVAHVAVEVYAVLTRLPPGRRVPAAQAAEFLQRRYPGGRLAPASDGLGAMLDALARAGVAGGAAYDGLIALTARDHGEELLTLDARAAATYERLGAAFHLL